MPLLATALSLSLLGSFGGLLLASGLLVLNERTRARLVPWLISYAVGALLGVSLLALLPEALHQLLPGRVLGTLLAGIVCFFVLEKLVLWRHCHTQDCEVHGNAASLVLIGGAFHHFVDGAIIGATVLSSVALAVNTAIAVAAHEIPQSVGDVAILLDAGYRRTRTLLLNAFSCAAGVVGALVGFVALDLMPGKLPYFLAFAAASFLYIAMADLIPGLHRGRVDAGAFRQVLLVGAGVLSVLAFS